MHQGGDHAVNQEERHVGLAGTAANDQVLRSHKQANTIRHRAQDYILREEALVVTGELPAAHS